MSCLSGLGRPAGRRESGRRGAGIPSTYLAEYGCLSCLHSAEEEEGGLKRAYGTQRRTGLTQPAKGR